MTELSTLPNIGPDTQRLLCQTGITSCDQLKKRGAEDAWLAILAIDPSACMSRLLALEGAIQGVKKSELSPTRKDALRAFFRKHKG